MFFLFLPAVSMAQDYEEDFEFFLNRFDQNSSFQFSRLRDSITVEYSSDIILDEEGNGHTENRTFKIARIDWKIKRIDSQKNNSWKIQKLSADKMTLTVVGRQSGVFVVLDFVLINGLWFLEKYADYTV